MKSEEIKEKELELQRQMDILKKQEEQSLVEEGKAYYCTKCKAFVDKERTTPAAVDDCLCAGCFGRKWLEDRQRKMLNKLKFAKIIDIEFESLEEIKQLTIYKNGMIYDLKATFDRDFDDNPSIVIDHEEKSIDSTLDVEVEIKPWQKERPEKPLLEETQ